jgi:hypothetical protein
VPHLEAPVPEGLDKFFDGDRQNGVSPQALGRFAAGLVRGVSASSGLAKSVVDVARTIPLVQLELSMVAHEQWWTHGQADLFNRSSHTRSLRYVDRCVGPTLIDVLADTRRSA